MRMLVPACLFGTISAFEQVKIRRELEAVFSGTTDKLFIAPICSTCQQRFAGLNAVDTAPLPDFQMI